VRGDYGEWRWKGPAECNAGTNPSNPAILGLTLGPYQVTVVNGLYFVLALRLNAAGVTEGTGPAANDLHGFLSRLDWEPEPRRIYSSDGTPPRSRARRSRRTRNKRVLAQ
jgi:hypothetical protein